MWGRHIELPVTGLHPGVDGLGSGVGFDVNGVDLNIAALHRCDFTKARAQWESYFQAVDGAIFVVNWEDAYIGDSCTIKGLIDIMPNNVPLLVLLCHDKVPAQQISPVSAVSLAEQLGLENALKNRWWCVRDIDMQSLAGICEGLQWLASLV